MILPGAFANWGWRRGRALPTGHRRRRAWGAALHVPWTDTSGSQRRRRRSCCEGAVAAPPWGRQLSVHAGLHVGRPPDAADHRQGCAAPEPQRQARSNSMVRGAAYRALGKLHSSHAGTLIALLHPCNIIVRRGPCAALASACSFPPTCQPASSPDVPYIPVGVSPCRHPILRVQNLRRLLVRCVIQG